MTSAQFQQITGVNPEHYIFVEDIRVDLDGEKQWTIKKAGNIQKFSAIVSRFEVINNDDFEDNILECSMKIGSRSWPREISIEGNFLKVFQKHAFGANVSIYELAAVELQEEKIVEADFLVSGTSEVYQLIDGSLVGGEPVNEVEGATAWWEITPLSSRSEHFTIPIQWNGQSGAWVQNPRLTFNLDMEADVYLPEVDQLDGILITRGVKYTDDEEYFSMTLINGVATEVETPTYHLRGKKKTLSVADFA